MLDREAQRLPSEALPYVVPPERDVERRVPIVRLVLLGDLEHADHLAVDFDREHLRAGIAQVAAEALGIVDAPPRRDLWVPQHREQRRDVVLARRPQRDALAP